MNRFLLDSHVLLWWSENPLSISAEARQIIANPLNHIYFSLASTWELTIKKRLGKITIPTPLIELVNQGGFKMLGITNEHIDVLQTIKPLHRDPFDHLLMAQALHEKMILITSDRKILRYDVPTIAA